MSPLSRILAGAFLGLLTLLGGCSQNAPPPPPGPKRVAIVPFRTSGAAESGQYALLVSNFSEVLATQFGAVSPWQVMESERLDTLETEQAFETPPPVADDASSSAGDAPALADDAPPQGKDALPSANDAPPQGKDALSSTNDVPPQGRDAPPPASAIAPAPASAAKFAAAFPSADYVLLGQINGFDVRPIDARGPGETLARRQNRVQARVDVRIVDVHTRAWLASRSVRIDERLPDDSAAETQINQAMSLAAAKVVNAVLLAAAGHFNVTDLGNGTGGPVARVSGGASDGVEVGQTFRVIGSNAVAPAARIQISEVLPHYALARVIQGQLTVGDEVPAQIVESPVAELAAGGEPRIAIGRFFMAGGEPESKVGGTLIDQITQELLLDFHKYSGLRVVEDRTGNIKDLLAQQMLEDLSKGRDPGLPMGSLHGVDYLIFGSIAGYDLVEGRRETTRMFGTAVVTEVPPKAIFDGTVYVLDVSRGEYMTASNLSLEVDLQGQTAARAVAGVARGIADKMFSSTLLQIRPLSVVDVHEDDVVLNHTGAAGIAVGDRFTAMTRGVDRLDPNTKTWMHNVGGQRLGELEVSGFDAGGWAHARAVKGSPPPAGSLLVRADETTTRETKSARKLTW